MFECYGPEYVFALRCLCQIINIIWWEKIKYDTNTSSMLWWSVFGISGNINKVLGCSILDRFWCSVLNSVRKYVWYKTTTYRNLAIMWWGKNWEREREREREREQNKQLLIFFPLECVVRPPPSQPNRQTDRETYIVTTVHTAPPLPLPCCCCCCVHHANHHVGPVLGAAGAGAAPALVPCRPW